MLRKSWFIIAGPTICTTSGFCAPGASCGVPERFVWACFVRLPWANIATAMPRTQKTEAVKMRRLKKADCEVDFFFMDDVSFFLRSKVATLSDTLEICQHFFEVFPKFSLKRFKPRMTRSPRLRRTGFADLKLAPFPTSSQLPVAALPSISLFPSARFTDDPEFKISGRSMAILVFRGNVTMLLPFGACYPQDKSAPPANMPKT